ncbi:sickle tail protein homolog isoform X3 [Synchiropus splendidus]|uniref:sickle tail protein homolog isoform X3 n=1 Tax=Synchiropus splendidus TaxID=270530 RepID=UPI00237D72B1|nr:sickle tail protein homolog isoform X3 [Synchiropus splendidus]
MSRASRLARPASAGAGSKLPSPRRENPGSAIVTGRARVLSVGEKLMRAGSETILTRRKSLKGAGSQDKEQTQTETQGLEEKDRNMESSKTNISPPKVSSQHLGSGNKQSKGNLRVTSPEDVEHLNRRQVSPNGTPNSRGDAKGSKTVPRRHTLGGARSTREILAMQPSDMDKKREAFLEHLKHKYPHHASAIMGHQERLREQSRSPKHSASPQSSIGDQADHLSLASLDSLEAMSEVDAPTAFTRGSRIRASLPVVKSTNQTKDRSLGVLYLQYGDETKQLRMPNEITSIDTIRALFVSAFPHQLNMKMLESPSVAVYVKDDMRNMYYELTDVRNITDHSCLKVYHKDPAQAFNHGPRPANGDARMHMEMVNSMRQPPMGPPPHHPMQGALPPSPHAMPPSPSRIPFGPRQGSIPGSATMPRERLPNTNAPPRSISPCPSAILERRDVKPDENLGGKSHSLSRANEGLYADPYLLQEGRIGMATAHGPHPGLDGPDHAYHRASIRSTSSYTGPSPTDTIDHPSLYRQKSRNSQLPTLGSKTPPPSPHRISEVRMIDIHGGPPHIGPMERSSPVRQSFRKEDLSGAKPRNMGSPVVSDLGAPILPAGDNQTRERMKAMEQQIASLTGLVQHALLKGPNTSGTKEPSSSERPPKTSSPAHSAHSSGGSPVLVQKHNGPPSDKTPLKVNLLQFRKNVSDLRLQLHQMRQLQLQNQEILRVQLKRAEQEISVKLSEAMRRVEDPVQKQRATVEEDRHKYLGLEEHVLKQLSDLEQYVGVLQKDTQRAVTLKEVEEGAVTLRNVGESLAGLKGEFPALQTRMRAVLRVEVEAVKFLKEEPHKLDSMLKRVKSLTDTLSSMRRSATETPQLAPDSTVVDNGRHVETAPSTQPGTTAPPLEPQNSTIKSEVMPSSPMVIHHAQSSPVHMQQSQQSAALSTQPSPPMTPTLVQSTNKNQGRESPKGVDPPSPAHRKKTNGTSVNNGNGLSMQDHVIEELQSSQDKCKSRAISIEAAEKEWEERRQNMGQFDGKEFDKILQEAQANMMKGLPPLEVQECPPQQNADSTKTPSPVASPTDIKEPPSECDSIRPVKKGPEKLPKPAMEKPAKLSQERPKTISKPTSLEGLTRQGSDKSGKFPPPPPPRKTYSSSGMTTTRSGEVVYTSRKESVSSQEGEEEAPPPTPPPKPNKIQPEAKKPVTPPLVPAPAAKEDEDDGDKIMAELQVFQKCTVKEVGLKHTVEPTPGIEAQIREIRAGDLLPLKEKKSSEPSRDDKDPDTDENGNSAIRKSQGVIYYVTGKIPKEPLSAMEETPERRELAPPQSQVSNVNVNENSSSQQQLHSPVSPKSPPPPISPKPVGLNGFKFPRKQMKRAESLKTAAEMEKGKKLKITKEKKIHFSSSKVVVREPAVAAAPPALKPVHKAVEPEKELPVSDGKSVDEEAGLSPDLPGEEAPPPPDNIAFMVTNTKVQALSCGEYQELVNAKKDSVETVTVGGSAKRTNTEEDPNAPLDNGFNKKPVIIIFDEPMDIRSAYKRLSTIFECEEELERMLSEDPIVEESEESDSERSVGHVKEADMVDGKTDNSSHSNGDHTSLSSSSSSSISELAEGNGGDGDFKADGKKKFKFKFPKKQFAALTQAIRTGSKSGKKTLQVVVYEDEEESDGTVRQHKEAKRYEIACSKSSTEAKSVPLQRHNPETICRTNEIRKNTYKTLDSLEQTIKQLETTITEMGPCSPDDIEPTKGGNGTISEGLKRSSSLPASRGPKLASKPSIERKSKPQVLPRPSVIPPNTTTVLSVPTTVQQNTSVASPTSRMPVPLSAKSRQSSATTDKAGKQQKLQDAQRQFRQANGSAKRVGGDHKTIAPTIPTSKIPAFYPSSTKSSSQSVQNSDAANLINLSASSTSVTKSSILSPRSGPLPSSHIPSLSNGSLKLPTPSQHAGKALSFSSQTQNGRVHSSSSSSSSFSSSSPSPLSPTPLGPGGKSIRTIHTPSFNSYRSHNGSSGKSCIPTATAAKDA